VTSSVETLPASLRRRIVVEPSGCWRWTAGTAGKGYAYGWWAGGMSYIHRVTYHLLVDPTLPIRGSGRGGLCIDHLCQNRTCVNPAHLELVTWSTNLSRWHQEHPERLEHARTFRKNSKFRRQEKAA
jgi:hypothetical protein